MYQIDNSTAAASQPGSTAAGTPGYFTDGNPAAGVPATIVPAEWLNAVMMELSNVVTGAGLTLSKSNYTQVLSAIKRLGQATIILADTGAANAYTATNTTPLVAGTWVDGVVQAVKIAHANTGASTYAPDGLPAIPIYGLALQPLQGGELALNGTAILMRATIAGVNSGNPIAVLMECFGGAQQVAPATQVRHAPQFGQVGVHGQCEFFLNGANVLLRPYNGNKLIINGIMCVVPGAGVSASAAGLAPGTRYLVYARDANGDGVVDALEFSTTGHSTDANTGVEIKTGDATRTLVGQVQPIAGPAFVDSFQQRLVRDWFNRRSVLSQAGFSTSRSTSATSPTELNSEIRNQYLAWEGEVAASSIYGTVTLSGSPGQTAAWGFAVDSTTALVDASCTYQRDTNSNIGSTAMPTFYPVSEGFHFTTMLGYVSASSATFSNATFVKTVLGGSFL